MRHKMLAALTAVTVVGVSTVLGTSTAQAANGPIADDGLAACINSKLGRATDAAITEANVASMTGLLSCSNRSITTIEGLQYATSLTGLTLTNNSASDLSPISGLTGLTTLSVGQNSVSDLSPISGLTGLTSLVIGSNNISDASPVANLTNLITLNLSFNNLTDLTPLAGLTKLTTLRVDYNNVALSDLSPLSGLTALTSLNVNLSSVSDVSALSGLTNLQSLTVNNSSLVDISPLAANTALTYLAVSGNYITDVSPLASLPVLTDLRASGNEIGDLSPFATKPSSSLVIAETQNPVISPETRYVPAGATSYSTSLEWAPKSWGGASVDDAASATLVSTGASFSGVVRSYPVLSSGYIRAPFAATNTSDKFTGYVYVLAEPAEFTSGDPSEATQGEAYSFPLTVTDGFPTANWSITSGEFPAGIDLSDEGELVGTPAESGEFTADVTATDTWGNALTTTLTLNVAAASATDVAPTVTDPANQNVTIGATATFSVTTTGTPTPAVTWEVSTDNGETWEAVESTATSPAATATPQTAAAQTSAAASASGGTLTVSDTSLSDSGNLYRATATNSVDQVVSAPAALTVTANQVLTPSEDDPADDSEELELTGGGLPAALGAFGLLGLLSGAGILIARRLLANRHAL